MSMTPIFSLIAPRNELGHATKGQIYISKIGIGAVVAFLLWLVSLGNADVVVVGSLAVFITSKVCYYVNKAEVPSGWDTLPDWITDGVLHFAWLAAIDLTHRSWHVPLAMLVLFLPSYPFSCE